MSGDSSRGSDGNHIDGFPVKLLVLEGWSGGQEGPETLSGGGGPTELTKIQNSC